MYKASRRAGGWCVALGIISIVSGLCVGIGCIIAGGDILSNSKNMLR